MEENPTGGGQNPPPPTPAWIRLNEACDTISNFLQEEEHVDENNSIKI